jgi:menaquinone-dependent protoporphyrinogen IX oxidase
MAKTLIVYHSRSGYTRRVASALARRLRADVEEIRDIRPVDGPIGYAICALEAVLGITPALRRSRRDIASYDAIVVGTPVWFWSLSSPVRTWLAEHRLGRKRVAFFCTMGGAGGERVLAAMAELARARPVATLTMTDAEVDSGDEAKLAAFARAVNAHTRPRARPRRARATHAPA